jgi:hypothetical protein
MNRRNPLSVQDQNIVNDMTPRRSTRVSSRSHSKNSEGRFSTSPVLESIVATTTPKSSLGVVFFTRTRKITLSPRKPSPSSDEITLAAKAELPSIDNEMISDTRTLPKKRSSDDTSTTQKISKRTKIGRWEKWEQITFLQGLREHGRGHWKIIAERIPTRYVNVTDGWPSIFHLA